MINIKNNKYIERMNLVLKLSPNDNTSLRNCLVSHELNSSCLFHTERDLNAIFQC